MRHCGHFDIGNGKSGVETSVSRVVLDGMRHLYALTGISLNNPIRGRINWNPLAARNYSVPRAGDIGANPWHVVLTWLAIVILGVAAGEVLRCAWSCCSASHSEQELLFTGIAKWSIYEVRYTLPALVALSTVSLIALARWNRWIARGILRARRRVFTSAVGWQIGIAHIAVGEWADDRYSLAGPSTTALEASAYQTLTTMIAGSGCKKLALANWVEFEYPLWVGLQHEKWRGTIGAIGVTNPTRRLEIRTHYCAWIRQEDAGYVTPLNGIVNVRTKTWSFRSSRPTPQNFKCRCRGLSARCRASRYFPVGAGLWPDCLPVRHSTDQVRCIWYLRQRTSFTCPSICPSAKVRHLAPTGQEMWSASLPSRAPLARSHFTFTLASMPSPFCRPAYVP